MSRPFTRARICSAPLSLASGPSQSMSSLEPRDSMEPISRNRPRSNIWSTLSARLLTEDACLQLLLGWLLSLCASSSATSPRDETLGWWRGDGRLDARLSREASCMRESCLVWSGGAPSPEVAMLDRQSAARCRRLPQAPMKIFSGRAFSVRWFAPTTVPTVHLRGCRAATEVVRMKANCAAVPLLFLTAARGFLLRAPHATPMVTPRPSPAVLMGIFDAFKSPEEFAVLSAKKELAAAEAADDRRGMREALKKLKQAESTLEEVMGRKAEEKAAAEVLANERAAIEARQRAANEALKTVREEAVQAEAGLAPAAKAAKKAAAAMRLAAEKAEAAGAILAERQAEQAKADAAAAELEAVVSQATAREAAAEREVEEANAEMAQWQKGNPGFAVASAGAAVGAAAGEVLLSSLFGEPKSVREAKRKKREEEEAAAEATAAARAAAEEGELREEAEAAAAEAEAAQQAADMAAAKARAAAEKNAAAQASLQAWEAERAAEERVRREAEAREIDAALRRKREEAEKELKQRRPRALSDAAVDAALGAAAAAVAASTGDGGEGGSGGGSGGGVLGKVASLAAGAQEKARLEAELKEKRSRMELFASDLALLGIPLDEAAELDDKALRKAFRDRSRLFHPDTRDQRSPEELEGVPSVYELNAAFEAVKKLL